MGFEGPEAGSMDPDGSFALAKELLSFFCLFVLVINARIRNSLHVGLHCFQDLF